MIVLNQKCIPERSFTRRYGHCIFPTKVFAGDCVTDTPEFHEVRRVDASIADVCTTLDSSTHMIKIDLLGSTDPLLQRLYNRARAVFERTEFGDRPCCMCVFRVSGRSWKFPMHFDCGHQIVLHVQGSKRWYWKCSAISPVQTFIATAGDVVYIPAGVWHATENLTATVIVNYGWRAEQSHVLTQTFASVYPRRQRILLSFGDALPSSPVTTGHGSYGWSPTHSSG